jgi:hypothetical protein
MKTIIVVLLAAAACGKSDKSSSGGGGGGGGETATIALGDSGFTVDAPKGWTVESQMKGFYDFKGGRGGPQIMESQMPPGTLDDAVKNDCDGRTVTGKDALPGGGWWLTCKGESKMVKGVQTTKILARIPKDDKTTFDCHYETDQDPALALGICKSIKKK